MADVTVLGAGMMGSALCVPLVDSGHRVRLVGTHLDGHIVEQLRESSRHPKLDYELPREICAHPLSELGACLEGAELMVVGTSSAGVRWAARQMAPHLRADVPVVMVSKGLEWNGAALCTLPDAFSSELPEPTRDRIHPLAIAGPCIAGELARRVETCVVFSGRDAGTLERARSFFRAPYYHVWLSTDVAGVESCAALKNAYAMGIAFGLGLHDRHLPNALGSGAMPSAGSIAMHNYEAAVFAQAVWEMQRIVELMGGDTKSVLGLAGVGDLDVTCNGGRTGRFGRLLGRGIGLARALEGMQGATLECLEILDVMRRACKALIASGRLAPGELPLLSHMAEVALDGAEVALPFDRFFGKA